MISKKTDAMETHLKKRSIHPLPMRSLSPRPMLCLMNRPSASVSLSHPSACPPSVSQSHTHPLLVCMCILLTILTHIQQDAYKAAINPFPNKENLFYIDSIVRNAIHAFDMTKIISAHRVHLHKQGKA